MGTTERTLVQAASDRVFAAQRAQHRTWLQSEAIREGLELLASDPEHGAVRAAQVIDQAWKRLQGLTEPETVVRPSGTVVVRSRAAQPFEAEAVAS